MGHWRCKVKECCSANLHSVLLLKESVQQRVENWEMIMSYVGGTAVTRLDIEVSIELFLAGC